MKLALVLLAALFALVNSHGVRNLQPVLQPIKDRILEGENAKIEDVPYQVALLNYGNQICGGSIISEYWVLTACHCVKGQQPSSMSVAVGTSQWAHGGSRHNVTLIIMHPQYVGTNAWADYDYAVLRVSNRIPVGSSTVQAIRLAWTTPDDGAMALVSGWGEGYLRVVDLKKVNVPVVGRDKCRQMIDPRLTDRMMCAGWPQGGNNTCSGDSGGPLVVNGEQVGIVSWAIGCANPNSPTVFADVANQRNWIKQQTGV